MRVERVRTGLWRWTGLHPGWTPADGWEREVGCVYYEAPDAVVLVDPLVPPEAPARFLAALDRDVERLGRPVRVLLTAPTHRRSSKQLAARYGATTGGPAAGVEIALRVANELVLWLPEHRALVFGDVVVGRRGGLALPGAGAGAERDEEVARALRTLLDLPAELALVAHGEPVLGGARETLATALG